MTQTPAIQTDALGHRYPGSDADALADLSIEVRPGEVFGVLGPNGGGKSTLFRILATRMRPTAGRASVAGHDVVTAAAQVRRAIGVVFQSPSLDDKLSATENIVCHAGLYGIAPRRAKQHAAQWLGRFGLADRAGGRVENFSGGMRRRVEIAKALVHQPAVLLMDEPAAGLDPAAVRDLWDVLHTLRAQTPLTIALTTHGMNEAERCDRLAILSRGRLIACDTPDALRASIGGDVVTLEPDDGAGDALDALAGQIGQRLTLDNADAGPRVLDGRIQFEHARGAAAVAGIAGAFPGRFRALSVNRPTLEDVFVHLTGSAFDADA